MVRLVRSICLRACQSREEQLLGGRLFSEGQHDDCTVIGLVPFQHVLYVDLSGRLDHCGEMCYSCCAGENSVDISSHAVRFRPFECSKGDSCGEGYMYMMSVVI